MVSLHPNLINNVAGDKLLGCPLPVYADVVCLIAVWDRKIFYLDHSRKYILIFNTDCVMSDDYNY